jgi:hypothetical protein
VCPSQIDDVVHFGLFGLREFQLSLAFSEWFHPKFDFFPKIRFAFVGVSTEILEVTFPKVSDLLTCNPLATNDQDLFQLFDDFSLSLSTNF